MRYTPNEREVDAKIGNQYSKAHTDFGPRSHSLNIPLMLIYSLLDRTSHHPVPPNRQRVCIPLVFIVAHAYGEAPRRLQVRTTSGEYKYVQYIPGHVVVNVSAQSFTSFSSSMLIVP